MFLGAFFLQPSQTAREKNLQRSDTTINTKFLTLFFFTMNYEAIILRKKNELAYAQRRLICAVDDFNQFLFLPDLTTSEEELKMHVTNWKNHVASLESDIFAYQRKLNQQSMNWGFE